MGRSRRAASDVVPGSRPWVVLADYLAKPVVDPNLVRQKGERLIGSAA
jgi:hypothetical protein